MSLALSESSLWISPEEYIEGEQLSDVRHEYLGGTVYAMSGASEPHNVISLNIATALREHLRGHRCRVYINDMKVRLRITDEDFFYYPDVFVACEHGESSPYFKEHPAIIFEVLSPATQRVDRRETLLAYQRIPSMEIYVLVEQERVGVTVYRRAAEWRGETITSREGALRLEPIGFELSVARVYEDVAI
jgi:Uma2 family endonuclease